MKLVCYLDGLRKYFDASRVINKSLISELAICQYLIKGDSVLMTGATGRRKSFIASVLGHQACAQRHKVACYNTQKLMTKIKMSRVEGSIIKPFENL